MRPLCEADCLDEGDRWMQNWWAGEYGRAVIFACIANWLDSIGQRDDSVIAGGCGWNCDCRRVSCVRLHWAVSMDPSRFAGIRLLWLLGPAENDKNLKKKNTN